jgi:hypothetical protein
MNTVRDKMIRKFAHLTPRATGDSGCWWSGLRGDGRYAINFWYKCGDRDGEPVFGIEIYLVKTLGLTSEIT